jgi:hypothetical protein
MKLGNKPMQSSFGIPEELEAQVNKSKKEQPQSIPVEDQPQSAEEEIKEAVKTNAEVILKALNIEISTDDFQQLVFKGSIDKEVEIIKGKLKATFHSLRVKEWEEVDELLTREINEVSMTKEGMEVRKGLLSISYGITHLQGNPLSSPFKMEDGSIDSRKMAIERRKKISEMAPAVVNLMLAKHASFTHMLELITSEPGDYLKNS